MEANELRIGNFVNFRDENHLFEILEVHQTGLRVKDNEQETWIEFDCFEPIPLTEDWLLKFGFNKRQNENVFDIKYLSAFLLIDAVCINTYDSYNEVDSPLCLIKYVHQLQNLYFSLTGEELTIK